MAYIAAQPVSQIAEIAFSVERYGYAFLNGWERDASSEALADLVGRKLTFGKIHAVHNVVPKAEAGLNRYSGIYGLGAFPFHTDMAHWRHPPRYLMLRCVKGYGAITTNLIDGSAIVERVGKSVLSRALVKPRRPLNGSVPLYSLLRSSSSDASALLRWDEVFIVPASRAGRDGIALFTEAIASAPKLSISLERPGDTLLIDNWRMLHGRSAVQTDQADRIIERAYFGELY